MALDATIAGAAANSYLTIAAADLLAVNDLGRNKDAWASASDAEKEAALIRATEDIDESIGRVPYTYSLTQALLFPRATDLVYGTSTPMLPVRLQRATYLQAAFILRNAKVLDDAQSFRARGLSSFSNPDGTGGTVAEDFSTLGLDARVRAIVDELSAGAIIGTIVST